MRLLGLLFLVCGAAAGNVITISTTSNSADPAQSDTSYSVSVYVPITERLEIDLDTTPILSWGPCLSFTNCYAAIDVELQFVGPSVYEYATAANDVEFDDNGLGISGPYVSFIAPAGVYTFTVMAKQLAFTPNATPTVVTQSGTVETVTGDPNYPAEQNISVGAPAPEPSTWALLAIGVAALLWRHQNMNRAGRNNRAA